MTGDVKALIAEARTWDTPEIRRHVSQDLLDTLIAPTDALEAATVAPAVDREAAVREYVTGDYYRLADQGDSAMLMNSMLDALVESGAIREHTAPTVDREELAKVLNPHAWVHERDEHRRNMARDVAGKIIASGLLRDVRDVQAEALSGAALNIVAGAGLIPPPNGRHPAEAWLHDRAQAIREARND